MFSSQGPNLSVYILYHVIYFIVNKIWSIEPDGASGAMTPNNWVRWYLNFHFIYMMMFLVLFKEKSIPQHSYTKTKNSKNTLIGLDLSVFQSKDFSWGVMPGIMMLGNRETNKLT